MHYYNIPPFFVVKYCLYHWIVLPCYNVFVYVCSAFAPKKLDTPLVPPPPPLDTTTSLSDRYIERQTARLLRTYNTTTYETDSRRAINYNENIDAVFYSKPEWTRVLKDEDNYLEKKWRTKVLMETTPRGNIVMYYDAYKLGFAYYSDQTVPYSILNAVSMKYVLTFFCRDFFMDETVVPESNISGITIKHKEQDDADRQQKTKTKTDAELSTTGKSWRFPKNGGPENDFLRTTDKSAFVKFKSYNNISAKSTNAPNKSNNPNTTQSMPTLTEPKQTNRFICLGKIRNVSFLQPPKTIPSVYSEIPSKTTTIDVSNPEFGGLSQSGIYSIFAPSSTEIVSNNELDTYVDVSIEDSVETLHNIISEETVSEATVSEAQEDDKKMSSPPPPPPVSLPKLVSNEKPNKPTPKPKMTYAEYKRLREIENDEHLT